MVGGDFDERVAQIRSITQELVKNGLTEGVQLKLDEWRGLQHAVLSATVSTTVALVYTVPAGKVVVSESMTLYNAALAATVIDIYDGAVRIDRIAVAATDSAVVQRRYRFATSIGVACAAYLAGTFYSFSFLEFPDTNRRHAPPA